MFKIVNYANYGLGGDKCGCNFNKSNTFIKASTTYAGVGESSKQGVKLDETKASGQHYAKEKLTKSKRTLIQRLYIQILI